VGSATNHFLVLTQLKGPDMKKHKIIVSLTSPYARKVRIAAIEKKIDFEMIVDVPWNDDTGVVKVNPLGKVPIWIGPDGISVYDSRVIVDYLETITQPNLFPLDPIEKIKVKQIESLADGIMDASLCLFAERKKRPKELQHPWWIDRQFRKVHRGLAELERILGDKIYFYGTGFTIADASVASALGYVGLRFNEDFTWTEKYPTLFRFYLRMMERISVSSTIPVL
jgi:glutathione S-transferase